MKTPTSVDAPAILIILGITGDLSKRKLLPAVETIAKAGMLPNDFAVLGITRRADVDPESLLSDMKESGFVREHLSIFSMDVSTATEYERLAARLLEIEEGFGAPAQRLFYFSVPPQASEAVIEMLGTSGLAKVPGTKLLLEKPFGTDPASATEMVKHIDAYFTPEQVYRIDHYVAKEMAQDLVVFREDNALFRRTWNKDFIERIEILASEKIGIEGRADFYEQTGALRDLVQSHLLQLAALALMEPAREGESLTVPRRRLAALKGLHIRSDKQLNSCVVRGQYKEYKEEVKNSESTVETFVSITLESSDARFAGVPITLTTGKALETKATEIRIFYNKDREKEANQLVVRLQPDEGISMSMWAKQPGYERVLEKKSLDFTYAAPGAELAEAYEKVFVDSLRSEKDLFISSEEVLESWRIIAPIQEAWKTSGEDLFTYETGSSAESLKRNIYKD